MTYKAIASVISLKEHPKADRLEIAKISGYQVVVQKGVYTDGELVLFFPVDGQLTHEVCFHNNLYREGHGENKDPKLFGYFDSTRRVKAISLRGEPSQGFMLRPECFSFIGKTSFSVGEFVNEVNGTLICNKYVTPATLKKQGRQQFDGRKKLEIPQFNKIGSTLNARQLIGKIPAGSYIVVTEKIDGTSGRTGNIFRRLLLPKLPWWKKLLYRIMGETPDTSLGMYQTVTGTRNTVVNVGKVNPRLNKQGEEIPLSYRAKIHNDLLGCIYENETIYYEIIVVSENGISHFNRKVSNRKLLKEYGNRMSFNYGIKPGEHKPFVYKITRQTNNGEAVALSHNAMALRAKQLGLETVPVLDSFVYDGNAELLIEKLQEISAGSSILDNSHIKEGVCLQIDSKEMQTVMKFKSNDFLAMESEQKEDPDYVDPEEIS